MTKENNYGFRFKDWDIYKDARVFRVSVITLVRKYPAEEKYSLVDQTKRALNSIVLNIAEGANKTTDKDTRLYVNRAHCSLDEVVACLNCALDDGYIDSAQHKLALIQASDLAKRLNGFSAHLLKSQSTSNVNGQWSKVNGFTLTELLVAMAVFAASLSFAVGSFVHALKTQRAANHLMAVNSNASLAIEQIAREIRTGYNFVQDPTDQDQTPCTQDVGGWNSMQFVNHRKSAVIYRMNNNALERGECSGDGCVISEFDPLTASNVKIENLCFIKTQLTADVDPWRITIIMKVSSPNPALAGSASKIQTTVSARILPEEVR